MNDSIFDLKRIEAAGSEDLSAFAIKANGIVLTHLLREGENVPDDWVHVPAIPLGFWLADHWWRLRWECRPPDGITADWRQAHEFTSIGRGYAWPRVTLWGESERIAIISRSDPAGVVGPVRFLQDALTFIDAPGYEASVDALLSGISAIATGDNRVALSALIDALQTERSSKESSEWRRLEAMAGFDPDAAPEELMQSLEVLTDRFSAGDIEEVVSAAPGVGAARTLDLVISENPPSAFGEVSFDQAVAQGREHLLDGGNEPWRLADSSAAILRAAVGGANGPILNRRLAELAGTSPSFLRTRSSNTHELLPYGVRIRPERGKETVLLRSRWGHDRRFELMRALGDAIWSKLSPLGPISRAATARQKFQRGFAASILCPAAGLISFVGHENPSDEDISAAARHFHVSERVVRSVLVNKRLMDRQRLKLTLNYREGSQAIEELADAA